MIIAKQNSIFWLLGIYQICHHKVRLDFNKHQIYCEIFGIVCLLLVTKHKKHKSIKS